MEWEDRFDRERARYEDGTRRLAPEQLLRLGNAAYGAALCLLMLGRADEASSWFERAAVRWRESLEHAAADSWGRPVGVLKALILGRHETVGDAADWTLELGAVTAPSAIGRYAAALALLAVGRDSEASGLAAGLNEADFPAPVADALGALAEHREDDYGRALAAVLESFEARGAYLEDVPVADTVLVLQELASVRGMATVLRYSALLPGSE